MTIQIESVILMLMDSHKLEIPILATERLRLEPISMAHSAGMFDLWSDEQVIKYSGAVSDYNGNAIMMPANSCNQTDLIIDFWIKAAKEGWGFRWAIMLANSQNNFVGTFGFNSLSDSYEIAYHLLPKYWGKGIMSEASKAAIEWAYFRGATSIEAFIEPENELSIAFINRLGMHPTGEFVDGAEKFILNKLLS